MTHYLRNHRSMYVYIYIWDTQKYIFNNNEVEKRKYNRRL